MKRRTLIGLAATTPLLVPPAIARIKSQQVSGPQYILATGVTSGTYYPVGLGIQRMIETTAQPRTRFEVRAISSAGSYDNIEFLRSKTADMGFCQALYANYARNGAGPWTDVGAVEGIRSVCSLWPNVEHFLMRPGLLETGSASELRERQLRMNLGGRRSGTRGSGLLILSSMGMEIDDEDLYFMGAEDSVKALLSNSVDLIALPGGVPVAAVSKAYRLSRAQIQMLAFDREEAIMADGGFQLWSPYEIPAGIYPGQDAPIPTIAQPNSLLVREDMDEDHVYAVLKGIFTHSRFLRTVHPAMNQIDLGSSLDGLSFPLHKGAQRFLKEQGLSIPRALR